MIEIRAIEDAEIDAFRDVMLTTFGDDVDADPDGSRRVRALVDAGRLWMAYDDGVPVATAGAYALELGVPGGVAPMAGLTMVTVRPTHRRRGILRRLIDRFVADGRARGAAIFGLWASEASIYGRFGFGVAVEGDALAIELRGLAVAAVGGEGFDACTYVDEAEAREVLPPIYARAIATRPGALHRSAVWWRERRFLETSFARGGLSRRRHVVARRAGVDVGYVVFRQGGLAGGVVGGKTTIVELVGVDPRAEASLWRFVAGIDLFPTAVWGNAPIDGLLPWIVADPRQVVRRREDTLWLRIDDVPAALAARRFACDGAIRIEVDGETHVLTVRDGRAETGSSTSTSTSTMTRSALSAIYLGGTRAEVLGRAGLISGDVAQLDRMFAWPVAPWCPEVF